MRDDLTPPRWKIVAAFGAVYTIWGSTYLAIAFAVRDIPPFLMTGSRFLAAGLILYAWARFRGAPRPVLANWRAALGLGALFFLVGNGALTWVEDRGMPSGLAAVLIAMVGAWTVLVEWVRPNGQRPRIGVLLGVFIGFVGVGLLILSGTGTAEHVNPVAAAVLMVSSVLWAIGAVYTREAELPKDPLLSAGMQMLCGGGLLLVLSLVTGDAARFHPAGLSSKGVLAFCYLLTFGSLVGFSAFSWLLQVASPAKVSTYGYVNPMVAVFLGWVLNGESLTLGEVIASVVIVAAVVVIVTSRGKRNRPPAGAREEVAPIAREAEVA